LKEAVCLPFMFSRIVREDRAARTVLVFGGEAFSFNTVKCELTNTPMKKELYIGLLSSVVISREICNWERFKNRRQVSSYTGLCPGEYSSGSKRALGSVTKHGNRRPRAALVELAWRMARFQHRYHPVQKRLAVLAKGARATGAQRKKAIVAVARQLAVDVWRLHTGRCTATILGFK
jgi:transposase